MSYCREVVKTLRQAPTTMITTIQANKHLELLSIKVSNARRLHEIVALIMGNYGQICVKFEMYMQWVFMNVPYIRTLLLE